MDGGKVHLSGDYSLDLDRACPVRGREPVHLRPQSYEVLRYLAANPGRLISKDRLISEVWQGRAVTDDSLVQCLRDVRLALGDSDARCIRTVRGRGYLFEPERERLAGESATLRSEQLDVVRVVVEETDEDAEASLLPGSPQPSTFRKGRVAALVATPLLFLAVGTYWFFADRTSARTGIETIAVLPFVNEGGDADSEYLADGLTESLINTLSRVAGLSVKARSTVFRYKGSAADPRTVAAQLSVQAVLNGRIVPRGDEVTLYLSLVDARTGNQLWGEQYVRRLDNLSALQHDITRDVSRNLQARLSGDDRQKLAGAHTPDPQAYLSYLKGRYYTRKTTEPDFRRRIAFYQQAIEADPTYALAYAGMADAFRALSIVGRVPSTEAFPQARAAARRALEIDDSLIDAHVALGWISFSFDWEWDTAERELRRSIELGPQNSDAHRAYAHLLSNLGRHDEALAEIRRAVELDPLAPLANVLEGQFLFYAGRDQEAEARYRQTLELEPNYWPAHNALGRVYLHRQLFPQAVAAFTTARELAPQSLEPVPQLGYALAQWGRRDEARALLARLEEMTAEHYVPAYNFAMIYNGLGDRKASLRYLERACDQREVQLTFIKIDTRWDAVRADPRFVAIARRVGLE